MIKTLRSVIGCRGQSVSALDRSYALRRFPTLVLWGTRDRMIPAHHASAALASNPGAEVALLDGTGHLPHLTRADRRRRAPELLHQRLSGSRTRYGRQPRHRFDLCSPAGRAAHARRRGLDLTVTPA